MTHSDAQIFRPSREALWWLLIAQSLIVLPHCLYLTPWLAPVWLLTLTTYVQVFRGAWNLPSSLMKAGLAVASVAGLFFIFGRLFALESLVGLLVIAFLFKLLELKDRRDVLLLIILGFFVTATHLLFSSSLLAFLYALACFTLLLITLHSLHLVDDQRSRWNISWQTLKLFLQALPLALLLFIIMPRMGSLWQLPMSQTQAKTGVGDSLSPGDINQLNKDNSPALRVTFSDDLVPANRDLYWRGLVLSDFDGRSWGLSSSLNRSSRQLSWTGRSAKPWLTELLEFQQDNPAKTVNYKVMMEASQQPWLYSLAKSSSATPGIAISPQFNLIYKKPLRQRFSYQGAASSEFLAAPDRLAPWVRTVETKLPANVNPRAQVLAQQWRQAGLEDQQIIERAFTLFNQSFYYSLQPPLLGQNSVDDFLFNSQTGYCEHFASSFVFLMRAANIPARVVVGYQGGQWNQQESYLLVRQSDAHAWAEVWLQGQGWQRFDPTSAVAAERIELGFRAYLDQQSQTSNGLAGFAGLNQLDLFYQFGLRWDSLNYSWQKWVLDFDDKQKSKLFAGLLGDTADWKIGLVFITVAGLVVGLLSLSLWWRGRPLPLSLALKQQQMVEQRLARLGLRRDLGETPGQFLQRAAEKQPQFAPLLEKIDTIIETLLYSSSKANSQDQRLQLKRLLKLIK